MILEPVCLICARQLARTLLEPVGLTLIRANDSALERYVTKNHNGNYLTLDAAGRASVFVLHIDPRAKVHIFLMQMDSESVWLGWANVDMIANGKNITAMRAKVAKWHADINNWTLRDCDEIPRDILRASRLAEALAGCKF